LEIGYHEFRYQAPVVVKWLREEPSLGKFKISIREYLGPIVMSSPNQLGFWVAIPGVSLSPSRLGRVANLQ